jgi:C-terminal processing protease CtpA/Prc
VPASDDSVDRARRFAQSLEPRHPRGPLSFWETYAMRSLADRMPSLGISGLEIPEGGQRVSIEIEQVAEASPFHRAGLRPKDELVEVDGEPFFQGRGLAGLSSWLMRELDERPRKLPLRVRRDGEELPLHAVLALEPF